MDFSGDNKYLTGIKLTGRSARRPTQDVSQAFMVNTVRLEKAEFKYPPSILASLPHIIRKPENLKYNYGIPATRNLIEDMIDLTYYQPDCELDFLLPDGSDKTVTVKSYTSLRNVLALFTKDLQYDDLDNLVLVRSIGEGLILRLPACNMPIGLFHVPLARWTFEFKWVPKSMNINPMLANMLNLYVNQRANEPTTMPKETMETIKDFTSKLINVSSNPTEQNKQKVQVFLDDMNSNPKYELINSRFAKTGEINITYFQITKDMKVKIWKGVNEPAVFESKDLVIKRTESAFAMLFGDDAQYPLPRVFFPPFYEFVNFAMFPNWESVKAREFEFDSQPRTKTPIPRVFTDSRVNFIKPEKLQEVIHDQLEFGKKFVTAKNK
ncbi:hypothetical protein TVAG_036570 [Trichomonas vaginalis G3]|uniref:Uncharacterized protein n=1 Tax=Trichomonas vaginalis (strain ATCC PRA-98 / G3) TaxID=412133 RepID=A2G237_TRIV3|nr:hypothetical protein TVAGG3_0599320 [Trichomonas vaginalis G3]EAX88777.1 hypothetical protein TVAG_036570 [Trichomonas vaginalis G3]KAI5523822.1 hypothetical protein TVAGG3_0599320 [Trichomonas vaginalis G3]|eukprot:XP_001301707.1 hypothetical protein [Trichomonas vaginalis G3]